MQFGTRLVTDRGEAKETNERVDTPMCRVILVPSFALTGILVLVNLQTLAVKRINFCLHGRGVGVEGIGPGNWLNIFLCNT